MMAFLNFFAQLNYLIALKRKKKLNNDLGGFLIFYFLKHNIMTLLS
jgi:hypothetical protein